MVNLLEKLNYTRTTLIQGKDTENREEGKEIFFVFYEKKNFHIDGYLYLRKLMQVGIINLIYWINLIFFTFR